MASGDIIGVCGAEVEVLKPIEHGVCMMKEKKGFTLSCGSLASVFSRVSTTLSHETPELIIYNSIYRHHQSIDPLLVHNPQTPSPTNLNYNPFLPPILPFSLIDLPNRPHHLDLHSMLNRILFFVFVSLYFVRVGLMCYFLSTFLALLALPPLPPLLPLLARSSLSFSFLFFFFFFPRFSPLPSPFLFSIQPPLFNIQKPALVI